jgi:hypothetical protein
MKNYRKVIHNVIEVKGKGQPITVHQWPKGGIGV